MLLLIGLLAIAGAFGLDVILGAFFAGMITRRHVSPGTDERLEAKIDGLAFGLFVPLFFVVSGMSLDVQAILESPDRLRAVLLAARRLPRAADPAVVPRLAAPAGPDEAGALHRDRAADHRGRDDGRGGQRPDAARQRRGARRRGRAQRADLPGGRPRHRRARTRRQAAGGGGGTAHGRLTSPLLRPSCRGWPVMSATVVRGLTIANRVTVSPSWAVGVRRRSSPPCSRSLHS